MYFQILATSDQKLKLKNKNTYNSIKKYNAVASKI